MRRKQEANLLARIDQVMELEGWRVWKLETVEDRERKRGFGEPGMPDRLYLRPALLSAARALNPFCSQVLYVEGKRRKETKTGLGAATKAKAHQKAWHVKERAQGFRTAILGEDMQATFEGFFTWYCDQALLVKFNREEFLWRVVGIKP